jgi:hypothetical protein
MSAAAGCAYAADPSTEPCRVRRGARQPDHRHARIAAQPSHTVHAEACCVALRGQSRSAVSTSTHRRVPRSHLMPPAHASVGLAGIEPATSPLSEPGSIVA